MFLPLFEPWKGSTNLVSGNPIRKGGFALFPELMQRHRNAAISCTMRTTSAPPAADVEPAASEEPGTMNDLTANDPLISPPPDLPAKDCMEVAADLFGIEMTQARRLTAERDLNLLLAAGDGRQFVMKVSNEAESLGVTQFQNGALCHVEEHAPDLPVPRVIRTLEGSPEARIVLADGRQHTVRLLSYLPGVPLHLVKGSTTQRQRLAGCLAKLDAALGSYRSEFGQEDLSWNIANLLRLEPLLEYQEKDGERLLSSVMEAFRRDVVPELGTLRRQVIYNDLNFHNVLVDETDSDVIAGIIDFGDIVCAPLVNDLAVACAYQFGQDDEPLAPVGEFIAAYHRILPLTLREADLLPTLIAARLATTVLITTWRSQRYPHNREYILRNNPSAWAGLHVLAGQSGQQLKAWVLSCCGMEV